MDFQKVTTGVTAAAVIGTGATIGGGQVIDNYKGGPEKRANAEEVRLREIIREELYLQLVNAWPTTSCLLYTSPSPRDKRQSRMPSSA